MYIYVYIGVKDLSLQDKLSLDVWRMGPACSGNLFRGNHHR